ncbi:hypothetical protein TSAR_006750 [Trichomalopsis sarcophagae]|uniref:Uncharacterized protein n=1 Tax=Trichomalopsis sarcophagae TaxID=543379 RepID=A0A232EUE3_9HYME|nr:hypothetical protein TSAR_006750 [Trichomalopsis sarcophagae]
MLEEKNLQNCSGLSMYLKSLLEILNSGVSSSLYLRVETGTMANLGKSKSEFASALDDDNDNDDDDDDKNGLLNNNKRFVFADDETALLASIIIMARKRGNTVYSSTSKKLPKK